MKRFSWICLTLTGAFLLLLSGCATNRSVLQVKLPDSSVAPQSNGKSVVIRSVMDNRAFEERPNRQDIPSIGFGGANASSSDLKKRAVGRKRNGYGKALGDILLSEGQTVESVIRDALQLSFAELGYTVLAESAPADADALVVDAGIYKFWAYMTPGFWTISLSTDISTSLTIRIPDEEREVIKEITVKAEGRYQFGSEENWRETIDGALKAYVAEAEKVLPK